MKPWRWCLTLVCMVAIFGLLGSGLSALGGGGEKDKDKDKDKDKVVAKEKDAKEKDTPKEKDAKEKDGTKDKDGKDAKDKDAKDKGAKEPAKAGDYTWKGFDKEFHQKLTTTTDQELTVMDQKIKQKQEQTFYVTWTPKEKDKDGNYVVEQKITGMKMSINIGGNAISYDSSLEKIPSNPMTDFFNNLKGATLTYHISPKLEIVKIEGRDVLINKLSQSNPQMKTLLETLLSESALKQMAQPTWGAFPPADRKGDSWKKEVTLNLGNIGSYVSHLDYTLNAKDKNKIDIASTLVYTAPAKEAKGAPKLPFTIKEAKKSPKFEAKGTGVAEWDPEKQRFSKVEMKTNISGLELVIEVGTVETNVVINQTQSSVVQTSDTPFPTKEGAGKEASK